MDGLAISRRAVRMASGNISDLANRAESPDGSDKAAGRFIADVIAQQQFEVDLRKARFRRWASRSPYRRLPAGQAGNSRPTSSPHHADHAHVKCSVPSW
jgi:hypothetical protein